MRQRFDNELLIADQKLAKLKGSLDELIEKAEELTGNSVNIFYYFLEYICIYSDFILFFYFSNIFNRTKYSISANIR